MAWNQQSSVYNWIFCPMHVVSHNFDTSTFLKNIIITLWEKKDAKNFLKKLMYFFLYIGYNKWKEYYLLSLLLCIFSSIILFILNNIFFIDYTNVSKLWMNIGIRQKIYSVVHRRLLVSSRICRFLFLLFLFLLFLSFSLSLTSTLIWWSLST